MKQTLTLYPLNNVLKLNKQIKYEHFQKSF